MAAVNETYPGVDITPHFAFIAPKGTPASILKKIKMDTAAVLNEPAIKQQLGKDRQADQSAPSAMTEKHPADQNRDREQVGEQVGAQLPWPGSSCRTHRHGGGSEDCTPNLTRVPVPT